MQPVIKGAAYVLVHVPDLVRYGSKPYREIEKNPEVLFKIEKNLRRFLDVVAYPPNQVFIGNLTPDELKNIPQPWFKHKLFSASSSGNFGEIAAENNFYGVLKLADINEYDLVWLEKKFLADVKKFGINIFFDEQSLQKIGDGHTIEQIKEKLSQGPRFSLPLFHKGELIGCFNRSQDRYAQEDEALGPHPLMEGLIAKTTGALALKHLLKRLDMSPEEIDFIISCSEEAVGDRYNRGGGSLAKAIGEMCGCQNATGPDIKAFCVSPIYAIIIAGLYVKCGLAKNVAVVGGGCLAKLGMKFQGHLEAGVPVMEDTLASAAFLIAANDGKSPIIRLDAVGKNSIKTGGSQQKVFEDVVLEPLKKLGKKITDIDKYGVQLENPDITIPAKSGDVAKNYYDMIAALAVMNKEFSIKEIPSFREKHGMLGFAPTQGHIPAAIPYIGHAIEAMTNGEIKIAMFLGRGSLFLGRMSQLYDGVSFILEKNPKQRRWKLWERLKIKNL